jgi:hypothetical protein
VAEAGASDVTKSELTELIARYICGALYDDLRDESKGDYQRDAEAALYGLTENGFAIVPKEPTEAMIERGSDSIASLLLHHVNEFGASKILNTASSADASYRAMLEAWEKEGK